MTTCDNCQRNVGNNILLIMDDDDDDEIESKLCAICAVDLLAVHDEQKLDQNIELVSEKYTGTQLRNIESFKRNPNYNIWKKFPKNIKEDFVKTADKNILLRKGKTVMNELIIRYSKIPFGSIFKKATELPTITKKNSIYFKNSEKIRTYNEKFNVRLMKWLPRFIKNILNEQLNTNIWPIEEPRKVQQSKVTQKYLVNQGFTESISPRTDLRKYLRQRWLRYKRRKVRKSDKKNFKKYIFSCAREMLYDKIRSHQNYVDISLLQCMGIACVVVAMKLILQVDALWEKNLTNTASDIVDGQCSVDTINEMILDILETTNYQGCYEVRRRLNDAGNPGKDEGRGADTAHEKGR